MTRNEVVWRVAAGSLGFYGAVLGSAVTVGALAVVFGPARDSALDRFVVQHIALFRGALWAVFFGSFITLPSSICGNGMKRGFGAALSLLNFLFSIGVLGAGE